MRMDLQSMSYGLVSVLPVVKSWFYTMIRGPLVPYSAKTCTPTHLVPFMVLWSSEVRPVLRYVDPLVPILKNWFFLTMHIWLGNICSLISIKFLFCRWPFYCSFGLLKSVLPVWVVNHLFYHKDPRSVQLIYSFRSASGPQTLVQSSW